MSIRSPTRLHHPLPPLSLLLSSSSPETTTTTSNDTLVPTAVSILRSHRRRSRWNHLKSLLPSSNLSPSQSSSIILNLHSSPHLALQFFLWTLNSSLCNHTLSSFSTIIHILARSRLRSPALSLLRSAIRSNPNSPLLQTLALTYRPCGSTPLVFDLLIQAYLHSHNLHSALSVLRSSKIRPPASTANSLLRAAASLRGSADALHLYRQLLKEAPFRPNSQTFNTLLLAAYRDGRTELNGEILREMDRFQCRPNAFGYSIRIAGCFDDAAAAGRVWEEMKGKGIEPDVAAYNTLMKVYCEAGEVEKGEGVCCEMVRGGMEVSGTTLEILIRGKCGVGDVEGVMKVYEEMRRRGVGLEGEVVDEVVEGMCGRGMVDEGVRVLRGEKGGRGEGVVVVGGGRRSYEAVIKGFCEAGRMEEAMKVQGEMAGRGMEVGVGVYEAFVCGYERVGEFEMAERLREEMGPQVRLGEEGG